MYIYQRVRDLREDTDKTQAKIAEELNVGTTTYRRWESGEREIPLHIIITLAKMYKVSLDYIVGLTNDQTPHWNIKNDNSNNNNKTVNIRQNGNKNSVGDINL